MNKKVKIILLIIVAVIVLVVLNSVLIRKVFYTIEHEEIIYKYSKEYGVDPILMLAIIRNESKFKTDATSHKNAVGLMQIMEPTANEIANRLGLENIDLTDAETNIQIGIKYFSELEQKYGNYQIALAAYNAGQGNVDIWIENGTISPDGSNLENIPYQETNMYVRRVTRDYKVYQNLYRDLFK